MNIHELIVVSGVGIAFSPLIAWRAKIGINPLGEFYGDKNNSDSRPFVELWINHFVSGLLLWPSVYLFLISVKGLVIDGGDYHLYVGNFMMMFSLLACFILVKYMLHKNRSLHANTGK